jgi:hypothetical protein
MLARDDFEPDSSRPGRRPDPNCYHLAERFGAGRLSQVDGPFSREEAERLLRACVADDAEFFTPHCVAHAPRQWADAEVVLTAEDVVARLIRPRCPGCGVVSEGLCPACGKGQS